MFFCHCDNMGSSWKKKVARDRYIKLKSHFLHTEIRYWKKEMRNVKRYSHMLVDCPLCLNWKEETKRLKAVQLTTHKFPSVLPSRVLPPILSSEKSTTCVGKNCPFLSTPSTSFHAAQHRSASIPREGGYAVLSEGSGLWSWVQGVEKSGVVIPSPGL